MNEAPHSSNFVLYKDGVRIQHTVRTDGDASEHAATLMNTLALLRSLGYTPNEAGLEVGQESYDVDGYVIGRTKKGDKVLWFYRDQFEFAVHGGVVYEDHWHELPFVPKTDKIYDGESKLSRDGAKERGYWKDQRAKIVVRMTDRVHEATGKNIWKFVSAAGSAASSPALPAADLPEGRANGAPVSPPPPLAPTDGDGGSEALCNQIVAYVSSNKIVTIDHLVAAALKAFSRRSELRDCWDLIEKTIRKRLVVFFNEADSNEQLDALAAGARAIGKILPEEWLDAFCGDIDKKLGETNVPF